MREITKIIVHCTSTPEGREVDVEEIRKNGTLRKEVGQMSVITFT